MKPAFQIWSFCKYNVTMVVKCCDIYFHKFVLHRYMLVEVYMYIYVHVLRSEGSPPEWSSITYLVRRLKYMEMDTKFYECWFHSSRVT